MITSPSDVSKRLVALRQRALEGNASFSRPAILGIRLYDCSLVSVSSPSNFMKCLPYENVPPFSLRRI